MSQVDLIIPTDQTPSALVPSPSAHALAGWGVTREAGQILVGGIALDPLVAQDLNSRLSAVLQEEEEEDPAWGDLSRTLDEQFSRASPVAGKTPRGEPMVGLLRRESEALALWRVTRFGVAWLRPTSRGYWEGVVHKYSPGIGCAIVWRPTRKRVRVPDGVLERAPSIDPNLGRIAPPDAAQLTTTPAGSASAAPVSWGRAPAPRTV